MRRGLVMRGLAAAPLTLLMLGGAGIPATAKDSRCTAVDYRAALVTAGAALHRSPPDISAANRVVSDLAGVSPPPTVALSPIVADLAASPPDVADAAQRLDAMGAALAYPPGSTCNQDGSAARKTLRDVYASPAFHELDAIPQQGSILNTVLTFLFSVIGKVAGALGAAGALLVILMVLAILALLLVRYLRSRAQTATARVGDEPATLGEDPDAEWRAAENAAAITAYREAVRRAFRAALLDVAIRGKVFVDAAWTTRELLERCTASGEVLLALATAASDFDRAWYSGAPVSAADWGRAAEHCGAVRRLVRSSRAPVA